MASDFSPPDSGAESSREAIEATAAAWLSLRDRGLSSVETAEFVRWLQLDPRHAALEASLRARLERLQAELGDAPR